MSKDANYIPPGHHTLTSYLYGGLELVDFVRDVFGAGVTHPGTPDPSGNVHSEVKIGNSMLLIGRGYFTDKSMAAATWIYVADVDATFRRAVKAGATAVREPSDQTWGDRVGGVKDSAGNTWWIATHTVAK